MKALDGMDKSATHPATLPPGKEPPLPTNRRIHGPQSRYEHSGEEKNLLPLLGIERLLGGPTR
jgi:hypothetical protein